MAQAHIEGLMADYQTLMNQVEEMRSTMQNYRARRGRAWSPDLSSSSPWQELIRARRASARTSTWFRSRAWPVSP
ncbi:MAG: hypothetical protein ACYTES_10745 [Planctomycetota bacterium]